MSSSSEIFTSQGILLRGSDYIFGQCVSLKIYNNLSVDQYILLPSWHNELVRLSEGISSIVFSILGAFISNGDDVLVTERPIIILFSVLSPKGEG